MQGFSDEGHVFSARLSPDGRHALLNVRQANDSIYRYEFARGAATRLVTGWDNGLSSWLPDSRRFVFASNRDTRWNLFLSAIDGADSAERLAGERECECGEPPAVSPDGKSVVFSNDEDLWIVEVNGDGPARRLFEAPGAQSGAHISPDARWIAYMSVETGRREVFVRPFPGPGAAVQVSTSGGERPRWAQHGRELFYLAASDMVVVDVAAANSIRFGKPVTLFKLPNNLIRFYDVSRDGRRFLMVAETAAAPLQHVVVLNWFEELEELARASSKAGGGTPRR